MRVKIDAVMNENTEFFSRGIPVLLLEGSVDTSPLMQKVYEKALESFEGMAYRCTTVEEFERNSCTPAFGGFWLYTGSLDKISKRDENLIKKFAAKPVKYGFCCLSGFEFTKYRNLFKDQIFAESEYLAIVDAGFPSFSCLRNYASGLISGTGCVISEYSLNAFVEYLGKQCGLYEISAQRLALLTPEPQSETAGSVQREIAYALVKKELLPLSDYGIRDFTARLLKPMKSDALHSRGSRPKLYSIYEALIQKYAAPAGLLNVLVYQVRAFRDIRLLINRGYLAAGADFNIQSALQRIPERFAISKRLQGMSEYRIKQDIDIASKAPLADWLALEIILTSDGDPEHVLFNAMTRSVNPNLINYTR